MKQTLGFIGCGRLGRALLAGWLEAKAIDAAQVQVAARRSAAHTARLFGVAAVMSPQLVEQSTEIILAVKPNQVVSALQNLSFRADQVVFSVVAGVDRATLLRLCQPARVVRIMPNVACRVGAGVALVHGLAIDDPDVARAVSLFAHLGHAEVIENEELFHVGTALVGSGPAFLFMAMEALADGAVAGGMSRVQAQRLVAHTVAGAGRLAAEDGGTPASLKDAVASPGGTTIAGIRLLEQRGMRSALIEAILAATARSQGLEAK